MPRNGSGTFVRETPVATGLVAWFDTVAAGDTSISTTDHDFHDQDIAAGLTDSIAADGQTTPTANLPMGGFHHTGVSNATARTNYAAAGQIQDGGLTFAVASGTDTYVLVLSPPLTAYVDGMEVRVRFINANTSTGPTLNINGVGAATITTGGGAALFAGQIGAGQEALLRYELANLRFVLLTPGTPKPSLVAAGIASAVASFTITGNATCSAPTVATGGTLNQVGDLLSFVGGSGVPAVVQVTSVSAGGVITGIAFTQFGNYQVAPSSPATVLNQHGGVQATINFTATVTNFISSAFPNYQLRVWNFMPTSTQLFTLAASVNGGSSYLGSGYNYQYFGYLGGTGAINGRSTSAASIPLGINTVSSAGSFPGADGSFVVDLTPVPAGTLSTQFKVSAFANVTISGPAAAIESTLIFGGNSTSSTINALQLTMAAGTLTCNWELWGYP